MKHGYALGLALFGRRSDRSPPSTGDETASAPLRPGAFAAWAGRQRPEGAPREEQPGARDERGREDRPSGPPVLRPAPPREAL